jgi:enoyl-CoA hydratase
MTDEILLEVQDDGIAVITFNRPQALNALDLAAMDAFAAAVERLCALDSLRVVILAGAGEGAFCSGGDLHALSQLTTEDDARAFITLMGDALLRLERLPVPVIAAINGYALGGGSEIAMACDLRIADERARMGFVQIRMAITPGWGAGQRLLRQVGYARALEILLQGRAMPAGELEALGLVNRIVPAGTALAHARDFARQIVAQPPDVVHGIKTLLQAGVRHPYEEALRIEREVFPPLWAGEAHLAAVTDFLKKSREKDTGRRSPAD